MRSDNQGEGSPSELVRLSVNITPGDKKALEEAMAATGRNQTDTVSRALRLLADLLRETKEREPKARPGAVVVYMTDPDDRDSTEKIVYL